MSAVAATVVGFDPLRDRSYRETRLGRDVADWLAWLELGGAATRTLDQYERDLARGALMFPAKGIADLEDGDAIQIAKTFQPGERRVRVAAYRSFYRWALRSRRVDRNPFDALPTIRRTPKKVYDLFTDPEITVLTTLPVRDGALLQLMFDTGARKGDCRNLRYRDWRPDATPEAPYGMLVFRHGKGGKDRQVQASALVAQKLAELTILDGLRPDHFLWYTRPGGGKQISRSRPIGEGSFARWWSRCLIEADVRYRRPHDTRHTFATRFLRGRGRLQTLQLILGHESIQTTADLYAHLDMRDVAVDLGLMEAIH